MPDFYRQEGEIESIESMDVNQDLSPTIQLTMVAPGQPVRVVDITSTQRVNRRLAEMGLSRGVRLEILKDQGGPLLISVRDTHLALGRDVAQAIMVRPVGPRDG
jgi:ferrous iron transport protein A